jgi:hypothetical protein
MTLGATPERFATDLKEVLEHGEVSAFDLLPEEGAYWDRLLPPPENAVTLAGYIEGSLRARREAWLRSDPGTALRRISLEFAAPALVPHDLLDEVTTGLPELLHSLARGDDHFALGGIVEICARRVAETPEVVTAGSAALERLGTPEDRLGHRAAVFAAIFVLASARLARHDRFRDSPAFWRRLAAATHASLVVRTAGVDDIDADSLLEWVIERAGTPFFLSGLLDRRALPRWRPDWIDRKHLVPDAVGRVRQALLNVNDEVRPAPWREYLDGLDRWLEGAGAGLLAVLPAVLEGDADPPPPELLPTTLRSAVDAFVADPSMEAVPILAGIAYTHGLQHDALPVLRRLLQNGPVVAAADDRMRDLALQLGAHLAVEHRDAALADIVVDKSLHTVLTAGLNEFGRVRRALLQVIECLGAYSDEQEGDDRLVDHLERIAFASADETVFPAFVPVLMELKRVRPSLRTRLGRSIAAGGRVAVPRC